MSSNDGSTSIVVKDVGAGRLVEIKNANTGNVVGSVFLSGQSTLNDATISVSTQSNPFNGEISVSDRNSPYGMWTSKVFDKVYYGDSFVLIVKPTYNPFAHREYVWGHQDRVPTLLRPSRFIRDLQEGRDDEFDPRP